MSIQRRAYHIFYYKQFSYSLTNYLDVSKYSLMKNGLFEISGLGHGLFLGFFKRSCILTQLFQRNIVIKQIAKLQKCADMKIIECTFTFIKYLRLEFPQIYNCSFTWTLCKKKLVYSTTDNDTKHVKPDTTIALLSLSFAV